MQIYSPGGGRDAYSSHKFGIRGTPILVLLSVFSLLE